MSSSVHIDNKRKDTLIIGEGPTQRLDETRFTAEALYPINFRQSGKTFVLSLQYNESNSSFFLLLILQMHINSKPTLCFSNISKDFTNKIMKKIGLKTVVKFFSVDFNPVILTIL